MRALLHRSLAQIIGLISVAMPVFAAGPTEVDLSGAKTTGSSAGAVVQGRFGSKNALNQNLTVPMTNSDTQMYTIDGSKGFTAALGIPSSTKFLEIIIQPGPAGDLANVIVAQDLNADNLFDHSFVLGHPVSGVCANGFISCTPGTWNNCTAYGWESDAAGKLSIEALPNVTRLAGCFCINSSCGSNLAWTNSAIVLKALGGGAVGAIQVKDATTAITNVAVDPVTITYFGQLIRQGTSAASSVPATASMAGPQAQQQYYGHGSNLEADRDNISLTQAGDPNSLYYQLNNSAAASQAEVKTCSINRLVTVSPQERVLGYRLKVFVGYDADGSSTQCYWGLPGQCKGSLGTPDSWAACKARLNAKIPDIIQDLFGMAITCETLVQDYFAHDATGPRCYGAEGSDPISFTNIRCYQSQAEQGEFEVEEYPVLYGKKDFTEETVSNGCSGLEADPKCQLRAEQVDGVVTMQNFTATGLNQLPTCRLYDGVIGPFDICRPWWQKQREYVCETTPPTFDLDRYKSIRGTTDLSGITYSFTDRVQAEDGSWSDVPRNGLLLQGDVYQTCMPACKVKRPKNITDVSIFGSVQTNLADNSSFDIFYLSCAENMCPSQPGDEVVTPCGCIDEFAQAASIIQTMRLSGADNICSSGTPKPP